MSATQFPSDYVVDENGRHCGLFKIVGNRTFDWCALPTELKYMVIDFAVCGNDPTRRPVTPRPMADTMDDRFAEYEVFKKIHGFVFSCRTAFILSKKAFFNDSWFSWSPRPFVLMRPSLKPLRFAPSVRKLQLDLRKEVASYIKLSDLTFHMRPFEKLEKLSIVVSSAGRVGAVRPGGPGVVDALTTIVRGTRRGAEITLPAADVTAFFGTQAAWQLVLNDQGVDRV